MSKQVDTRKAAMIGCGFVGSASAFALMQSGLFSELVLIDANHDKAEGEAMDIAHGLPFAGQMKIYAGDYDDIVDAAVIIVTAGAAQKPGETRLDLVNKNVNIFKSIIPEIAKRNYKGILLIVANPVDILTYTAVKLSGLPENRVIEHGDSEIVAWSSTNVSGIPVNDFCELRGHFNHEEAMHRIADDVKNSAYDIIEKKGATYYGIAMSVKRICECIMRDEKSILPISSMMHGEYGISDICLSMPTVVGREGVETRVPIQLNEQEESALSASAEQLSKVAAQLDLSL